MLASKTEGLDMMAVSGLTFDEIEMMIHEDNMPEDVKMAMAMMGKKMKGKKKHGHHKKRKHKKCKKNHNPIEMLMHMAEKKGFKSMDDLKHKMKKMLKMIQMHVNLLDTLGEGFDEMHDKAMENMTPEEKKHHDDMLSKMTMSEIIAHRVNPGSNKKEHLDMMMSMIEQEAEEMEKVMDQDSEEDESEEGDMDYDMGYEEDKPHMMMDPHMQTIMRCHIKDAMVG